MYSQFMMHGQKNIKLKKNWFSFYFIFQIVNFLDVIFFCQWYVSWRLFFSAVKRWEDVSPS